MSSLFNQTVNTPKGKATYIAPVLHDGEVIGVQVSRFKPAAELTPEERERAHPSTVDMDHETLAAWLKSTKILVNEIYPAHEVTA